jgi:clan AA aspartic protease
MGTTYAEITLKNDVDVGMQRRGLIKESEVRQITLRVVADTGADTLIINEAVRAALGLELAGPADAWLADGNKSGCQIAETVAVHWKDRFMTCQPWVLAGAKEVLLGAIPLENMDLMVDPTSQQVVGAHGDQQARFIR